LGCKPCREKRIQLYLARGMSREEAEQRANKIMPLIDKALADRPAQKFEVNIEASEYWTKQLGYTVVIGKGYNPDYTKPCTVSGAPTCKGAETPCVSGLTCKTNSGTCACGCPAPLPNSSQVSACSAVLNYICVCDDLEGVCTGTGICQCVGTCGYNCDLGFIWNGVACVPAVVAEERFDGYYFLDPA